MPTPPRSVLSSASPRPFPRPGDAAVCPRKTRSGVTCSGRKGRQRKQESLLRPPSLSCCNEVAPFLTPSGKHADNDRPARWLPASLPQLRPYLTLLRGVPSSLCPSRRRPSTVYAPSGRAHLYTHHLTRMCELALVARARLGCGPGLSLGVQAAGPCTTCTWMNTGARSLNGARTQLWVLPPSKASLPVLRVSVGGTRLARLVV